MKAGGKRLKSIQQESYNTKINGVETMVTKVEVTSALESIEIILPMVGFWKLEPEKTSLKFHPREGSCAEFKILIVQ